MAEKNHWIDSIARDRGTYRYRSVRDVHEDGNVKVLCNNNDMEDALIDALDAGLSVEEIVDIQLGSIS